MLEARQGPGVAIAGSDCDMVLEVTEYSPKKIKQSINRQTAMLQKKQVMKMLQQILSFTDDPSNIY